MSAALSVQKWGNSLAVRIPSVIAAQARFQLGQPVSMSLSKTGIVVRPVGTPKLSLAQKLARFDPALHGGELLADAPVGVERID